MSKNGERITALPDEVKKLISLGSDGSDDVVTVLKTLPDKFETTSNTESVEEALQLLGTTVGQQSRQCQFL
jgi:hypothetical protein